MAETDSTATDWFAATLDSDRFDATLTLRPPVAQTPPPPVVDHAASTVQPGSLQAVRADTMQRELPHLTWTEETDVATAGATDSELHAPADFVVVSLLGEGGMGKVHLARQRSLHRDVALKTVKPEADRASVREGLWREALVMGRLDHPNVVPVHVLGVDKAGRPALVMKRIEGTSWQDLIDHPDHPLLQRLGTGDRLEAHLEVLCKVADALEFAHSRGVLHRDVKPDNVMVGAFGEVYLGDWGVALELTPNDDGTPEPVVGTPAFLAPEMLTHRRADQGPHTDVFLLGATLHAVLTGQPRHAGKTLRQVLDAARDVKPVAYPDAVPAAVAAIANKATAAVPSERYASAAEFRQAVRWFLQRRGLDDVAKAAGERLDELAAVLRQGPGDERDAWVRRVHQLASEARFGFQQVHAADPHHDGARQGLQACLRHMIAFELAAGHLQEARALYADLGEDVPQFAADLQRLEQEDAAKAADREKLVQLQRDHDPRAGVATRLAVAAPMMALGIAITAWATTRAAAPTVGQSIGIAVVIAVVLAALSAFMWRRTATALNRQLIVTSMAMVAMLVVHRTLAYLSGATEIGPVLRDDALFLALAGCALYRFGAAAFVAAGIAVATAVGITLWPGTAIGIFSGGIMTFMSTLLLPTLVLKVRAQQ